LPIGLLGLLPGFVVQHRPDVQVAVTFQWLMLLIAALLADSFTLAKRQGWLAKVPHLTCRSGLLAGLAALIGLCLPFLGRPHLCIEGLGVPLEADAGGLGILFAAILIRLPAAHCWRSPSRRRWG
jgi:hypothetical protein